MSLHSILDNAIATLRAIPHVVVDRAVVLPAVTPEVFDATTSRLGVQLPPWVAQLYREIGGAQISWRLGAAGYAELDPERPDNPHRYDISGNLDLLSIEEVCQGLTGHRWPQLYGEIATDYLAIDFSSFFVNMGCSVDTSPVHDGPVLLVQYDDRRIPLDVTIPEYLKRGADLLFMTDWQHALTSEAEYAGTVDQLNRVKARVEGISSRPPRG